MNFSKFLKIFSIKIQNEFSALMYQIESMSLIFKTKKKRIQNLFFLKSEQHSMVISKYYFGESKTLLKIGMLAT